MFFVNIKKLDITEPICFVPELFNTLDKLSAVAKLVKRNNFLTRRYGMWAQGVYGICATTCGRYVATTAA